MGSLNQSQQAPSASCSETGMADALFSQTRQKLLGLLFSQVGREFSLSEMINLAHAGSGAVQREVGRLVDSGLVLKEGRGRPRRYRANPDSPIYSELSGIAQKLFGPAEVLKRALEPLRDRMALAILYGSVAKGTDSADSDIDVLIVADGLLLEDVFAALADAEQRLGRKINPTLYTVEEFRQRRDGESPFLTDVLQGDFTVLLGEIK